MKTFIELFNNGNHQADEESRSEATLQGNNVEIKCINYPNKFYHLEDAVRISQALGLSMYAKNEDNELKIIVF